MEKRGGGLVIRGGREREEATSKGDGKKGIDERGYGKGEKGNSPKVSVSRINTGRLAGKHCVTSNK